MRSGPGRGLRGRPAALARRACLLAALAVVPLPPGGCSRPGAFTVHNLLLVSMDALAADRLGCYGDPEARTPFWDRLAREGCQFRTAVSPTPLLPAARASLLGGELPRPGEDARDDAGTVPEPTLAEILSSVGVATAAFAGSDPRGGSAALSRGFQRREWGNASDRHDRPAADVVDAALQWIRELDASRSFFLFVGVQDAPGPRGPAPPWGSVVADPRAAAIAATDRRLLRLLRGLEGNGRLDRTLVVATADHGATSGGRDESVTTSRVPFVLWGPLPFRGGHVRPDLARTVDVLPTALEAFRVGTRANRPGRALQKRPSRYGGYRPSA